MRELLAASRAWPETLPHVGGDAAIVAGLDGCIDALDENDAVTWIERDLKAVMLGFQDHYGGSAALIFWLPSGRKRIEMESASESYTWRASSGRGATRVPLGRCLWGGAEADVERVIVSNEREPDFDGEPWIGLHLPRIS